MSNKLKKSWFLQVFILLMVFNYQGASWADVNPELLKQAEQGDAGAQYSIARIYELGKRVKSDKKKALHWYNKSASQGYTEANYRLGLIYYKGVGGFKTDFKKAFEFLLKAAKANHKRSQTHLAKMYENGDGVDKSEVISDYWYEMAFEDNLISLDDYLKQRAEASQESTTAEDTVAEQTNEPVSNPVTKKKTVNKVKRTTNLKFPNNILAFNWTQNGKASVYLKSKKTRCKKKSGNLVCTSAKLKGLHNNGLIKYKVRSILSSNDSGKKLTILYKRLYLSVPEEDIGGYDDLDEDKQQKQTLKTGWEANSHQIPCEIKTNKKIVCKPAGESAFNILAN